MMTRVATIEQTLKKIEELDVEFDDIWNKVRDGYRKYNGLGVFFRDPSTKREVRERVKEAN